jgi:Zn-dependent protease
MIPVAFLSLSVHEFCHGYASFKLGDPTARNLGRLTLNPIKHIDVFGFICMVLFRFGWAKPVPVNARYYKNPKRDMAITAAAGPISNLILAFIGVLGLEFAHLWFVSSLGSSAEAVAYTVREFFVLLAQLNVCLAIFNLIPVPPLDGSRILYVFLPTKIYFGVMKYERVIMVVMLVMLYLGFFDATLGFLASKILGGMIRLVELIPIFS